MLPESSIVNMMFGLTGLRPWIGTSASVSVIGGGVDRQRLKRDGGGERRGRRRLQAVRRKTVIAMLLGRSMRRAAYFSTACAYVTVLRGPSTRTVTR